MITPSPEHQYVLQSFRKPTTQTLVNTATTNHLEVRLAHKTWLLKQKMNFLRVIH